MAVHLVRSARLFAGTGYAYAATASAGDLIFTAGACPLDKQGKVADPGDLIAQTRLALANLRIALEDSGAAIGDVVKTTVYVASSDRGELAAAFDEVAAFFGDWEILEPGVTQTPLWRPDAPTSLTTAVPMWAGVARKP